MVLHSEQCMVSVGICCPESSSLMFHRKPLLCHLSCRGYKYLAMFHTELSQSFLGYFSRPALFSLLPFLRLLKTYCAVDIM